LASPEQQRSVKRLAILLDIVTPILLGVTLWMSSHPNPVTAIAPVVCLGLSIGCIRKGDIRYGFIFSLIGVATVVFWAGFIIGHRSEVGHDFILRLLQ